MYFALIFLLCLSLSQEQTLRNCRVPAVCTRPNGRTNTVWVNYPSRQAPATATTSSTTSMPPTISGSSSNTIQDLNRRITLLSEPGWFIGNNDYQYWVSRPGVNVPYSNAEQICRSMGSQIAVEGLRSNSSRVYIVENILKRCGDIHGFWIGYRKNSDDGPYEWNDGEGFTGGDEADWAPDQPDIVDAEGCAVVARYFEYKWDDVPCESANNGVLCERYIGPI